MRTQVRMMSLLAVVGACAFAIGSFRAAGNRPGALAEAILDATGVRGGLVVHLGCGDGRLTAALCANERYVVHGLAADARNVRAAREHIRSLGLYGRVAVEQWRQRDLPYADNLVNLVVSEGRMRVPRDEIMRVLAPGGIAYIRQGTGWTKIAKPRPGEIDEWTHYLHDATNNAVAHDSVVDLPRHLQWVGDPEWARSHDHLSSISAAVSSGGRIFTIVDEGETAAVALQPRWLLVARDAFSGVLLWQRAIPAWEWHLRGFRSGPPHIARRLVADGDRVYVTLGYGAPLTALDAATGEVVETYDDTQGTEEILCHAGSLFLAVGDPQAQQAREAATRRGEPLPPVEKSIVALNADTGQPLWRKSDLDTAELMPLALAIGEDRVFFQSAAELICLDAASGDELWRAPRPVSLERPAWSAPTLVVYGDVVLSADREAPTEVQESPRPRHVKWTVTSQGGQAPVGELIAFSAANGERLWSCPSRECYNAPVDVLVANGLVWTGDLVRARDPGITQGRDPRTGEVKLERPADQTFFPVGMAHHRCYRNKATDRYLLLGRAGVDFIDTASGTGIANHWVRGACQYGILACNGLLYAPSHSCACYIQAKLNGFSALAPATVTPTADRAGEGARLERGPAYAQVQQGESQAGSADDWPTYRHDATRTGRTEVAVSTGLTPSWNADLGGKLTSLVAADGRLFVAQVESHTVCALDAEDGTQLWSYTAGGRVDSPPTIHRGLALFGSADGYVYCLRASDGQLVWRFRAAPGERRVMAYGQLESAWPVPGNVLVQGETAYAVAGRSSFLDGGIYLVRLDVKTGEMLSETRIDSRDPETGGEPEGAVRGFHMDGALPDILSSDGDSVYMRHMRFDREGVAQEPSVPHLFSPAGFVDDSWWHRTYWLVGTKMNSGWGGWPTVGNTVPAGRILAVDGSLTYGYGRNLYARHGSHVGLGATEYQLFCIDSSAQKPDIAEGQRRGRTDQRLVEYRWAESVDLVVRAMVLADETLLIAGPPDSPDRDDDGLAALASGHGGVIRAVSPADGQKLADYPLDAPPVFDSMIVADGRVYLATEDGKVRCFEGA